MAFLALQISVVSGCSTGEADPYEGAILVPIADTDRHRLAALIASFGHRNGYYLRDSSNYMKDTAETLTFYIVVYRGLANGDEWSEIQAHAVADDYPIVTFNKPPDGEASVAADQAWAALTREITQQWPQAGAIPILPHGGVPLTSNLVPTTKGYKINRAEAGAYDLPPSSPLLAD